MTVQLTPLGVTFPDSSLQLVAFSGARAQVFTASGTFTIPTGITAVKVTVCGGGGNGGTGATDGCGTGWAGGGGGGAGVAIKWLTGLTPGATIIVTRGAAAGSSTIASGTQTITTVTGGAGGTGSSASPGTNGSLGTAGTATNGDINLASRNFTTANIFTGGGAGTSGPLGNGDIVPGFLGGTPGISSTTASLRNATGYGNGGGGGPNGSYGGGSGSGGIIIFEW